MKNAAFRNIKRMDDPSRSTHGWLVRVQRHHRIAIKLFSDGVWGGKRKALAAARDWRDLQTQPLAEYSQKLWRRNGLRRNNRSGVVGAARYERKPDAGKKASGGAFWMASWVDEHGASRKRKFSVSRWGERGAKRMAIEEREQQVRRSVAAKTGVGLLKD